MSWYLHEGAVHEKIRRVALPVGAIKVPRPPKPGERWDAKARRWKLNAGIAADFHIPAAHIEAAHLIKQVEASLVLSGVALTHGLLAEEAAATGQAIKALAAKVASKASTFREIEVGRRKAKRDGGNGRGQKKAQPKS